MVSDKTQAYVPALGVAICADTKRGDEKYAKNKYRKISKGSIARRNSFFIRQIQKGIDKMCPIIIRGNEWRFLGDFQGR